MYNPSYKQARLDLRLKTGKREFIVSFSLIYLYSKHIEHQVNEFVTLLFCCIFNLILAQNIFCVNTSFVFTVQPSCVCCSEQTKEFCLLLNHLELRTSSLLPVLNPGLRWRVPGGTHWPEQVNQSKLLLTTVVRMLFCCFSKAKVYPKDRSTKQEPQLRYIIELTMFYVYKLSFKRLSTSHFTSVSSLQRFRTHPVYLTILVHDTINWDFPISLSLLVCTLC